MTTKKRHLSLPPSPPTAEDLLEVFRRVVPADYASIVESDKSWALIKGLAAQWARVAEGAAKSIQARYHLESAYQTHDPASSASKATGYITLSRSGAGDFTILALPGELRIEGPGGRIYLNAEPAYWTPGDFSSKTVLFECEVPGFLGNLDWLADDGGELELDLFSVVNQDRDRANQGGSVLETSGYVTSVRDSGRPSLFNHSDVGLYLRVTNSAVAANVGQLRKVVSFLDSSGTEHPAGSGLFPNRLGLSALVRRNPSDVLVENWSPIDSDTVFISESIGDPNNWTALADDLSSSDDDLGSVGADHADEDPHVATDGLEGDRCIEALVWIRDSGAIEGLVCKGATGGADEIWDIRKNNTDGHIRTVRGNGAGVNVVNNLEPPGLSSTAQRYWIAWSDAANPDATGAGDARLSHLRIWRIEDGAIAAYAEDSDAHAICTGAGQELVVGALTVAGGNDWQGGGQSLEMLRISSRPRSRQEIEDELLGTLFWDGASTVFTNYWMEATTADTTFEPYPATPIVNDAFYVGGEVPFAGVSLELTAGDADWEITWEYWDGSAWQAIPDVDDLTQGFTYADGQVLNPANTTVRWEPPQDWAQQTSPAGGSATNYYVRARISALTTFTTNPVVSRVTVHEFDPLVAESQTLTWSVLDYESLGVGLDAVQSISGGRDNDLYLLGRDRGMYQQPGETDTAFRKRITRLPDSVSPNAILRTVNQSLAPYHVRGNAIDVGNGLTGMVMDVGPDQAPDAVNAFDFYEPGDATPTDPWILNLSVEEAFGFGLVLVPPLGYGDFGAFLDEGPVYFDETAQAFYGPAFSGVSDGYPTEEAAVYSAVHAAVAKALGDGIHFTLVKDPSLL